MSGAFYYFILITLLPCGGYGGHFEFTKTRTNETCILVDANFTITIEATPLSQISSSLVLDSEDATVTTGGCGSKPVLILGFPEGVTLSLMFRTRDNTVTLHQLIQFVPKNIFMPPVTTMGDSVTFNDTRTTDLSPVNTSFVCRMETMMSYRPQSAIPGNTTFSVTSTISYFKAQAFGVENGTYSPSVECSQDNDTTTTTTTTPSSTTTTNEPVTTTPNPAPINTYHVVDENNITCIALSGRIYADIKYESNSSKGIEIKQSRFHIPRTYSVSGNCMLTNDSQSLVINFFDSWKLEFIFQNDKALTKPVMLSTGNQARMGYRIQNVSLTFEMDQTRFPGSTLPDGQTITESSSEEKHKFPYKSQGTSFYSCKSTVDLKLSKNATVATKDLKFKAFNDDSEAGFDGSASRCLVHEDDDKEAAIIAGSIVGGIIFIIGIAIVIKVIRNSRRGYLNLS